jgi:hypothetical protein
MYACESVRHIVLLGIRRFAGAGDNDAPNSSYLLFIYYIYMHTYYCNVVARRCSMLIL